METLKKTLVFFWYVKIIEFCPFQVVFRFSGPVLCQKNIIGCSFRYFHWECLALGACSTSCDNSELMPGPQRFLLSMSTRIDRRPARLTFRRYRSTLPAVNMQYQVRAPLGTNSHHASHLQRIKVVISSTHCTPDLPVHFLSKTKSHT